MAVGPAPSLMSTGGVFVSQTERRPVVFKKQLAIIKDTCQGIHLFALSGARGQLASTSTFSLFLVNIWPISDRAMMVCR